MRYHTYNGEWQRAIEQEIMTLKQNGGTPILATRGRFLYGEGERFIYHFRLHGVHHLQEGGTVRIVYEGKEFEGEVLFFSSYEVELQINEEMDEFIPSCHLFHEPWELLAALNERLLEIEENDEKKARVLTLVEGNGTENHHNTPYEEVLARAFYNPCTYIWGPPGTGKSYTLTNIVVAHYLKGQSVLILAHSNAAVDVLMKNVSRALEGKEEWTPGEVLRYGQTTDEEINAHPNLLLTNYLVHEQPSLLQQMHRVEEIKHKIRKLLKRGKAPKSALRKLPQLEEQSGKLRMKLRKEESDILHQASVVGSTLSKCIIDRTLYEREFDLVIVDEISMAYTPQLAVATTLGKRIVVCGDFMQLPPIASGRTKLIEKWLKQDLFEHVQIVKAVVQRQRPKNLYILDKQWRMHPKISAFTNHHVYLDEVSDHESVWMRQTIADGAPFEKEAAIFLNSDVLNSKALQDSQTKSRYNLHQALLVIQGMLHALKQKQSNIGVVTPYRAQSRLLNTLIDELLRHHPYYQEKEVVANTIHKFQGSERDMVFFDTVDGYPQTGLGGMYKKADSLKLINVAITRSRGKFIAIGQESFVRRYGTSSPLFQLTKYLKTTGHDAKQELDEFLYTGLSKRLQWYNEIPTQYKQDIIEAKETVEISCTALQALKPEIKDPIRKNSKILFTAYVEEGKHKTIINKRLDISFCCIDEQILWLGIETNEEISLRLHGPKTIALLKSYLGIAHD